MQIGRYDFDPLAVVMTEKVSDEEFTCHLPHGVKVTLNAEEKKQLDDAVQIHNATLYVYGVARAAGLRG